MKLDVRRPTITIAGSWNPAIFQPGWMARFLFDVDEGKQVAVNTVFSPEEGLGPIHYIDQVGARGSTQRLDIYCNESGLDYQEKTEEVALSALEKLPHTPVSGFGINFFFLEPDPDPDLLDALSTTDPISERFTIVSQELKATIRLEECALNLTRHPDPGLVTFDFNYHHGNVRQKRNLIKGSVKRYLDESLEILSGVYNLDKEFDIISHSFSDKPGEK